MKTYAMHLIFLGVVLVAAVINAEAEFVFPVTASSVNEGGFAAEMALDGNLKTRWASVTPAGEAWWQVDLGRRVKIEDVHIVWEAAYAVAYDLEVSDDGTTWKGIFHQAEGKGGEEVLTGLQGEGRWLRIACHQPTQYQLYSIWEVTSGAPELASALNEAKQRVEEIRQSIAQAARQQLQERLTAMGVNEVVFVARPLYPDGHWYANISYYANDVNRKTYVKGGGLYVVRIDTDEVRPLVEDPEGTFRDPVVHYDGKTILFSWRKGGTEPFHLYTIQSDGSGLRQLTHSAYDDIEPAWLPDGGIVFVSSRCRRWVNCWLTQVAVVHRCDADGGHVTALSANLEQDNTPWSLPDGRILYTRWEYVDRSQVDYHHLWTMNPDGTGQTVYFGNMHPGGVFIDAKPVPDSEDVVFINSPGHGAREHAGQVALVNAKLGPDELKSIRNISGGDYRDPYPLGSGVFIAARGQDLMALGDDGVEMKLHAIPEAGMLLHEPRPLVARNLEPVIPPRVDYSKTTGRMVLANVYAGRNMTGVAPGEVKQLLVLESLPKPINYTGGMDPLTYGGSFTLERVLGTVPVEEDGSAYFEVPANRAVFFVALDEKGDSVKRMQSFCSVMPGETLGCVGCHEARTTVNHAAGGRRLQALMRAPSGIAPVPDIPDVFDFPRDIQPILDQHCVACHDYDAHEGQSDGPRAGGVILSGDHGPMFSHSYATLTVWHQFIDGRDQPVSNLPPRSIGTGASPIMKKIRGGHHDVQLSAREIAMMQGWIDSGATYPGTYAALGCGSIGGYFENTPVENDVDWPSSKKGAEAIARRCGACHVNERQLPKYLSDENALSFWRPEWKEPRLRYVRHLMFNLSRPEKSMVLLAPLAREAGGFGLCAANDSAVPVFASTEDPDYQAILEMCNGGAARLAEMKRFDMPGFRPPMPYVREMQRYGALPADLAPDAPVDFYTADRAYWDSFALPDALEHPAYRE